MASNTPTPQVPNGLCNLPDIFKNAWTMYYRHGVNAGLTKTFFFEGTFTEARDRAMKHCGIMGYRYIFIRPTFCDIEYEEGVQLGLIDPKTGKFREAVKENETVGK